MVSGCGAVGSALPWGGRGRKFKSCHSDQIKPKRFVFGFIFCIFGAKSSVFPPLPHHPKFRNFFDHIFDHSWSGGESFGCFCSGTLCSRKTKFKRFPEIFPPRTFFLVYCVSKFKRENDCRPPFSLTVSIKEATAILLSAYLLLQIF